MGEISAVDYLRGLITIHNYKDTTGVIFFKGGLMVKVPSFFDYYQEQWTAYNRLMAVGSAQEKEEFLTETDGGVISNGVITISLPDVLAMIRDNQGQNEMPALDDME